MDKTLKYTMALCLFIITASCSNETTSSHYEGYLFVQNFIYEDNTPDEYNSILSNDGLTYTIQSEENVIITSLAFVSQFNPLYTPDQPIENQWLVVDASAYKVTYIDEHNIVIDFNEEYEEQLGFYYTFKYYQDN